MRMALHPDDPPWPIFGLPRIITDCAALDRLVSLVDREANGITFCAGSLASRRDNDVVAMARRFSDDATVLKAVRREDLTERLVYEFDRAMIHHCCLQSLLRAIETGGPPAAPHECETTDQDRRLTTGRPRD